MIRTARKTRLGGNGDCKVERGGRFHEWVSVGELT